VDKILILDFGGQTAQLIGRRIRDFGVYSDIIPPETELGKDLLEGVKGLIFSGSPWSVYEEGAPQPHPSAYSCKLPILGICYGFQQMTTDLGGAVLGLEKKEYGRSPLSFPEGVSSELFHDVPEGFISWMSHGDSIATVADGFRITAKSEYHPAAAENLERSLYGLQFHPEVSHCEYGNRILENFVCRICGAEKSWTMESYLEELSEKLRRKTGDASVLLLISGGVDSTVVAGVLLKALDPDKVFLMYIDTGLMRKNETEEVEITLKNLGARHLSIIDARDRFLDALAGVDEPEKKREIIGDLFVTVQQSDVDKAVQGEYFLAQGTLYTDLIESGKGIGKNAKVIKSHHNVRSPLIEAKRESGMILEPLDRLYKDEVRVLGRLIGLPETVVGRHPFPGPGLAVRILGEVTREKCRILREADAIYIEELRNRGLYNEIWQAFAVLLPIKSVGVSGDIRRYGYVLALRAIISHDGMTADVYPFETKDLLEISARITNNVPEVGRVVYDISSKPPATIEWE
jgi:GMP synthase (glutamine-hydrolysing)